MGSKTPAQPTEGWPWKHVCVGLLRVPGPPGNQSVGNYIQSPLLEVKNYLYGIDLQSAENNLLTGVECWDGTAMLTTDCVHLDSASVFNHVILSYYNTGTVTGVGGAGAANAANTVEEGPARLLSWKSGDIVHLGSSVPTNDITFGAYTVSGMTDHLPTSPPPYTVAWVRDSNTGDCMTGGVPGIKVQCFYDGANWVPMGNRFSPSFGSPVIGNATGLSLAVSGNLDGKRIVFRDVTSP